AGNGEKELGEAIAGLRKASSGSIKINGFDVTKSPPSERTRKGLVYIPEDPFKEGTAVTLSIIENMRMYARERLSQDAVLDAIKKLGIVPENPAIQVSKLSGGNVQKVSISRLLLTMPKVVVAHNPTRMLDERSRALVLDILQRFSLSGGGVLLITEDVDEAVQISDKVAVMVDGRIAKLFEGSNLESFRSEIEKAMVHG
ncbi:MAG: ATP-binding cassette domain-containing protein, partial [Ignisphaera sp.]